MADDPDPKLPLDERPSGSLWLLQQSRAALKHMPHVDSLLSVVIKLFVAGAFVFGAVTAWFMGADAGRNVVVDRGNGGQNSESPISPDPSPPNDENRPLWVQSPRPVEPVVAALPPPETALEPGVPVSGDVPVQVTAAQTPANSSQAETVALNRVPPGVAPPPPRKVTASEREKFAACGVEGLSAEGKKDAQGKFSGEVFLTVPGSKPRSLAVGEKQTLTQTCELELTRVSVSLSTRPRFDFMERSDKQ